MKTKAFTLIELMIVIAVIAILAAIALNRFSDTIRKSTEAFTKGNLGAIRSALSVYYSDNEGIYPQDDLTSLTAGGRYLLAIPVARTTPHHPDATTVLAELAVTDTGFWSYFNTSTTETWGIIRVGCLHQDMRNLVWSSY